jgi:pre-mRNA-splicing factor RBM22/SLT11
MQKGNGKMEDRIKDRYNGVNDALADKILNNVKSVKVPQAPEDLNITTIFVGGITEQITKEDLE